MSENASVFKIASILNISGYSAEVITHMLYPAFVTVVGFRHNMHECLLLAVVVDSSRVAVTCSFVCLILVTKINICCSMAHEKILKHAFWWLCYYGNLCLVVRKIAWYKCVPLAISYRLYFLSTSKDWSMLHHGSVGCVQCKECYFMAT